MSLLFLPSHWPVRWKIEIKKIHVKTQSSLNLEFKWRLHFTLGLVCTCTYFLLASQAFQIYSFHLYLEIWIMYYRVKTQNVLKIPWPVNFPMKEMRANTKDRERRLSVLFIILPVACINIIPLIKVRNSWMPI